MKIEVVINPKIFDILPHQMVSSSQFSIIWQPLNNTFVNWWCSHYIDREMYNEEHFTTLDSYKKLYNHWELYDGKNSLKQGTEKLRRIIKEINEYIEDPKYHFPIKPEDVNIKFNAEGRKQLNDIHRYFVRIQYPTTPFNKVDECFDGPRNTNRKGDYWRFNWHLDRCDYNQEEPYKEYPGDFAISRWIGREFIATVNKLNYGCHNLEPFFYEKSKTARNMIGEPGLIVQHKVSTKWRERWHHLPQGYTMAKLEETKLEIKEFAKKKADIKDIPPHFEHFQSSEKYDVWLPQNCILGKSVSIAYLDNDDPKQYDVNNGHQANFAFEFTDRSDRDHLRKIGYGGKKPYGWPLGRIETGKEVFKAIQNKLVSQEILHDTQLVKEIKVWE